MPQIGRNPTVDWRPARYKQVFTSRQASGATEMSCSCAQPGIAGGVLSSVTTGVIAGVPAAYLATGSAVVAAMTGIAAVTVVLLTTTRAAARTRRGSLDQRRGPRAIVTTKKARQ